MIFPKSTERGNGLSSRADILETFVNLIIFSSQFGITPIKHLGLFLISPVWERVLRTIDCCQDKETWQDSGLCTVGMMEEFVHFFKEARCMQIQLCVLILDPFTKHKREKGLLREHGVGANASHPLKNRRQRAVSGHSPQVQVLIKCLIISLI